MNRMIELAESVRFQGDILADEMTVMRHTIGISDRAEQALANWDRLSFELRQLLRSQSTIGAEFVDHGRAMAKVREASAGDRVREATIEECARFLDAKARRRMSEGKHRHASALSVAAEDLRSLIERTIP